VIEAKTPKQVVGVEAEDIRIDNRSAFLGFLSLIRSNINVLRIIKDEREGRKMKEVDLSELLD